MQTTTTLDLPSFGDVQVTMYENGEIWLRSDFDEVDPKEQWTIYCLFHEEVREALEVELVDVYVKHNRITARIKRP